MKDLKMLLISFFFVCSLSYVTIGSNFVSADDDYGDYEEKYENQGKHEEDDQEEAYEEIGETMGWATVIAMGAAGLLFPIRRSAKWTIKNWPKSKSYFLFISRFFGKYHLVIGFIALALSIFHGAAMYLSEGKLDDDGMIGLGAGILMIIASIFGGFLFKYKKVKGFRTTHTIVVAISLLIGVIHILAS